MSISSYFQDAVSILSDNDDILGLNERNLMFLRPNNKRRARKIADNKLITKKILVKNQIATPKIISQIRNIEDLESFDWHSLPKSFALKPKNGYEGRGIIVISGKSNKTGLFIKTDGRRVEPAELKERVLRILDGEYSLRNEADTAFFEQKVTTHHSLAPYAYKGVPDIRVIVYNKVPVMAELRLPTKASDGKANLHRGGIIVGIDMASGTTTTAVQYDNIIEYHPDNDMILSGIRIPYWDKILELSVKCQMVTGIGFLGADIVIDDVYGPMVMELNARPGLGIQIANQDGLKGRLNRVKGLKIKTMNRGVNVAKSLFGGDIEESIEEISGKQVIGIEEKAKFMNFLTNESIDAKVKIDTGATLTTINYDIAEKIGLSSIVDYFNNLPFEKRNLDRDEAYLLRKKWSKIARTENPNIQRLIIIKASNGVTIRPLVKIKFEMSGLIIETKATIEEREGLTFPAIIGKKDLKRFLIDITKK
ncbi:MAG: sugar-transfer associated ATP-grasp domain-containing protein [bacterium]